mgnify:CR=1 FL=1
MNDIKKKKNFNNFILLFILIQPFIDALTCIQIKSNFQFLSISVIFRGIAFVTILIYLIIRKDNRKSILFFIIYFLLSIIYTMLLTNNNINTEITNLFQIFYLPFFIIFFSNYNNEKINNDLVLKLYFIYLNLIIIPYFLGIGYSVSEFYKEKIGYLGLFYGGNEISAILICLLPISLKTLKDKNQIIKIIFIIELFMCTYLIGTKTLMFGVLIVFMYFFILYLKNNFNKFSKLKKFFMITIPSILLILLVIILPFTPMFKNIITAAKFFKVDSNNLFSMYGLNKIVFSGRLGFLEKINDIFINSSILSIFMGIGKTTLLSVKLIEIDILDIFYSIGIIGFVIWLLYMIKGMKSVKFNGIYKFTFILLIIISIFAGHILTSTNVSIYLALMIILNKNKKEEANE